MKCYQKIIKERKALENPKKQHPSLDNYHVKEINRVQAKSIILEYEWLGTMGMGIAHYGLFNKQNLIGAVSFGLPSSPESRNICGLNLTDKAICLERGACVHWVHKHAPSFFISRAVSHASKKYDWEIFYAYADEDAGEIGTIYQACNWYYLGQGVGRRKGRKREYYKNPDGKVISSRSLRKKGLKKSQILKKGWEVIFSKQKHKYVWFEGTQKRKDILISKCRYNFKEYPKREKIQNEQIESYSKHIFRKRQQLMN